MRRESRGGRAPARQRRRPHAARPDGTSPHPSAPSAIGPKKRATLASGGAPGSSAATRPPPAINLASRRMGGEAEAIAPMRIVYRAVSEDPAMARWPVSVLAVGSLVLFAGCAGLTALSLLAGADEIETATREATLGSVVAAAQRPLLALPFVAAPLVPVLFVLVRQERRLVHRRRSRRRR